MTKKYNIKVFSYKESIKIIKAKNLEKYIWTAEKRNRNAILRFDFNTALRMIWTFIIQNMNSDIEINKPWELAKNNPKALKQLLNDLTHGLYKTSLLLEPFLPETSQKIQTQLKTLRPAPLFPRIK